MKAKKEAFYSEVLNPIGRARLRPIPYFRRTPATRPKRAEPGGVRILQSNRLIPLYLQERLYTAYYRIPSSNGEV